MGPSEIQAHCPLDSPARQLLDTAFERLALSAAALDRVLRVARTLADLAGAERLGVAHKDGYETRSADDTSQIRAPRTRRPSVRRMC